MKIILLGSLLILSSASFLEKQEATFAHSEMIYTKDRKIFSPKEMIMSAKLIEENNDTKKTKCSSKKCWIEIINSSSSQ